MLYETICKIIIRLRLKFDNLMLLWYDEENDNFVELGTEHNADASTVSVHTSHFSKYLIVDSKTWFETWAEIAEKINNAGVGTEENLPIATAFIVRQMNSSDPIFDYDIYDDNGNVTETIRTNYRHLIVDSIVDNMADDDKIGFAYFQRSSFMLNGFSCDKEEAEQLKDAFYNNVSMGFNTQSDLSLPIAYSI